MRITLDAMQTCGFTPPPTHMWGCSPSPTAYFQEGPIEEGLVAAKPVITRDGPAVHRQMVHGEHPYLCGRANPTSLAEAVRALIADPELCRLLAEQGDWLYRERFDLQHIGARFATYLRRMVGDNRPPGEVGG